MHYNNDWRGTQSTNLWAYLNMIRLSILIFIFNLHYMHITTLKLPSHQSTKMCETLLSLRFTPSGLWSRSLQRQCQTMLNSLVRNRHFQVSQRSDALKIQRLILRKLKPVIDFWKQRMKCQQKVQTVCCAVVKLVQSLYWLSCTVHMCFQRQHSNCTKNPTTFCCG